MWLGLDANTANATNRVGAIFQTTSAITSLKETKRVKYMIRQSYFIIPPILIGAIIGANLAVDIPESILRACIETIMIGLLITMLSNPKKWLIPTDGANKRKHLKCGLLIWFRAMWRFYSNGVWNILSIHKRSHGKYALKDGNIMKLFTAFLMTIPSFIIFALSGSIDWIYGLTLPLEPPLERFGAKKVVHHPKASAITRKVLIAVILVAT